jgi:hypothetical protein
MIITAAKKTEHKDKKSKKQDSNRYDEECQEKGRARKLAFK